MSHSKPDFEEVLETWAKKTSKEATKLRPGEIEAFRSGQLSEEARLDLLQKAAHDPDGLHALLEESDYMLTEQIRQAHTEASWEAFQQKLGQDTTPKSREKSQYIFQWRVLAASFFIGILALSIWTLSRDVVPLPTSTAEAIVRDIYFGDDERDAEPSESIVRAYTLRLHLLEKWHSYDLFQIILKNPNGEDVEILKASADNGFVLTATFATQPSKVWRVYSLSIHGVQGERSVQLTEIEILMPPIKR